MVGLLCWPALVCAFSLAFECDHTPLATHFWLRCGLASSEAAPLRGRPRVGGHPPRAPTFAPAPALPCGLWPARGLSPGSVRFRALVRVGLGFWGFVGGRVGFRACSGVLSRAACVPGSWWTLVGSAGCLSCFVLSSVGSGLSGGQLPAGCLFVLLSCSSLLNSGGHTPRCPGHDCTRT